jgi:hypothetical protein
MGVGNLLSISSKERNNMAKKENIFISTNRALSLLIKYVT